jgi:predicted RNA-binding protein associated with RNAse of E/G family
MKEEWCLQQENPNTFLMLDENTLIEFSPQGSNENIFFIYLIDLGLQFEWNDTKNWYTMVDIVEIHEIKKDIYCVSDLFIDVEVYSDGSYKVLDIDEYEEAIQLNVITSDQISKSLKSFHYIIDELNRKEFPNDRIKAILNQFMKTIF